MNKPNNITVFLLLDPQTEIGKFYGKFCGIVPEESFGVPGRLYFQCASAIPEGALLSVTIAQQDKPAWVCRIPVQFVALVLDTAAPDQKRIGFT